jgi:hypothetical protein
MYGFVPIHDTKALCCSDVVAVCIIQEIIQGINMGQKIFGSLWLLHDRMHG